MKKLVAEGFTKVVSAKDKNDLTSGVSFVKEKINFLTIFVSLKTLDPTNGINCGERQYILIPFAMSEYRFELGVSGY